MTCTCRNPKICDPCPQGIKDHHCFGCGEDFTKIQAKLVLRLEGCIEEEKLMDKVGEPNNLDSEIAFIRKLVEGMDIKVFGKLKVDDIEIKPLNGMWFVRISIGDSMYFDTPTTFKQNAIIIYENLIRRGFKISGHCDGFKKEITHETL